MMMDDASKNMPMLLIVVLFPTLSSTAVISCTPTSNSPSGNSSEQIQPPEPPDLTQAHPVGNIDTAAPPLEADFSLVP
jgi:hypothetical protein